MPKTAAPPDSPTEPRVKRVNLALQGGGAHGAFTWGVLDALLEDGRIEIAAISGTSAGAMNAVALADGFTAGGPEGARAKLHHLWHSISQAAQFSPVRRSAFDMVMGTWTLERSWGYRVMDLMTRLFSPYEFNPLDMNPLRDIVESCIDFDSVRHCDSIRLFISATNVETGRVKVFDSRSLTVDMVMASACLPHLFHAVVIDGVPYWDGGYMGNPVLFPFHTESDTADTIVVQINPIERPGIPRSAHDIQNRVNEISFNSSLLKELRSIDFVTRLIDEGKLDEDHYRRARIHIIENTEKLAPLGASSKMNAEWAFLTFLRDLGRETAIAWLDRHHGDLGRRSTVDLRAMFQGIGPQHQG
ncbi:NTE family protein [Albidovulum inexpectatum]|uniref:NTE family protein n=1 Tax=Albidovulum inexpectatum TaxID=196587 RepID=A0A2S5JHT5_9RHOB|nr:patatin-like phospholipase family protein [Albidovulum inexpectatum]PPB80979.1 NTE family protein [Albidovulum inexpectatum]